MHKADRRGPFGIPAQRGNPEQVFRWTALELRGSCAATMLPDQMPAIGSRRNAESADAKQVSRLRGGRCDGPDGGRRVMGDHPGNGTGRPPAYRAPEVADGKPDLNGIWQALNTANYDIQMHMARPAMAVRPGPYGPVPADARSGARRRRRRAAGHGRRRRQRDAVPAGRARAEEEESGELAHLRPRDQVLPARRAARDLHALSRSRFFRATRRSSSPTSTPARCATST